MTDRLLSTAEAAAYWDARHRRKDDLRSGGHIGLDYAGNEMFYARRLGALLELIGDQGSESEPMFVLDAGCGKGQFARALARCGHRVDAIDASPSAIEYARATDPPLALEQEEAPDGASAGQDPDAAAGGAVSPAVPATERNTVNGALGSAHEGGAPPRWAVCTLDQWESPWPYDAVYSIDVLFHVLDDDVWRRSLDNLASLVRFGGTIVVTDEDRAQPHPRGNYILHRPPAVYLARLEPRGFTYRGFRPYGFRGNEVGFHVFTRTR
jgi:2-polyprenyl-3-methyl-5-hydroxy-6-metoxy-1,4-benzoquinol methylase